MEGPVPSRGRPRNRVPLLVAGAAGLVGIGVLGGLTAADWLRSKREAPPAPLRASVEPVSPPVRQAAPPQPEFRQAAPEQPQMPPEVRDWLEFLRIIEEERQRLARDQVSKALVTLASLSAGAQLEQLQSLLGEIAGEGSRSMASPAQRARMDTEAMRQAWVDLHAKFLTRRPPSECLPVADRYDQVLRETGGMMHDILQAVAYAEQDPASALSALQGMKGKSRQMIDAPARDADQGVAEICRRYGVPKWFSIQSDEAGGGIFQRMAF
ncbi:MAG: hypothetical protein N2109_12025 [Fimbriimonadales bacterium]|nr:hypothetical protein [Fimbriimonadales bacterium]